MEERCSVCSGSATPMVYIKYDVHCLALYCIPRFCKLNVSDLNEYNVLMNNREI